MTDLLALTEPTCIQIGINAPRISTAVMCRLTGLTYRQVDYWTRLNCYGHDLSPGSGRKRAFTREDVRATLTVKKLATVFNRGISTDMVALVVKKVRNSDDAWLTCVDGEVLSGPHPLPVDGALLVKIATREEADALIAAEFSQPAASVPPVTAHEPVVDAAAREPSPAAGGPGLKDQP